MDKINILRRFFSITFLSISILAIASLALAGQIEPYAKVYQIRGKLVKVVEVRDHAGRLFCHIGEIPQANGLNVLEDLGWVDCQKLREVK